MSWYLFIPFGILIIAFIIRMPIGLGMFVGSIAYYFSDYLIPILTENNLKLGIIAENPLDAFSKTLKSND